MARGSNIIWLRVWVGLCATALLCACTSSMSTSTSHGSAMLAVPGTDYKLLMPPPEMQQKIEALIRSGEAPGYITMPERRVGDLCGRGEKVVLGCVYETKVGKTIFIASTTAGEARHMVLVHE